MTITTLHLIPVPAEESCAQLGRTWAFDRYALLEANVHRAALIARFAPHLLAADALGRIALAKRDADRRRALEATMLSGLRYVRGWPPRLPTLAEAACIAAARAPVLARHGLDDRYPTANAVVSRFAELRGETLAGEPA